VLCNLTLQSLMLKLQHYILQKDENLKKLENLKQQKTYHCTRLWLIVCWCGRCMVIFISLSFLHSFKGLLVCSFLFMVLQLVENKTSESRNGICQYPFPFVHSCNMTLTVSQVSGWHHYLKPKEQMAHTVSDSLYFLLRSNEFCISGYYREAGGHTQSAWSELDIFFLYDQIYKTLHTRCFVMCKTVTNIVLLFHRCHR